MNTSKIIELKGLKASWNEHLQKMGVGEVLLLPSGDLPRAGAKLRFFVRYCFPPIMQKRER